MIKLNPSINSSVSYKADIFSDKPLVEMRLVIKTPTTSIGFKAIDNKFNISPFSQIVEGMEDAELMIECEFIDKKVTIVKDKVIFDNSLTEGIKYESNDNFKAINAQPRYDFEHKNINDTNEYNDEKNQDKKDGIIRIINAIDIKDYNGKYEEAIKSIQKNLSKSNQGQK